jgi:molybdopterin-guanine dinucleotide biosynthesis protein A
MVAHFSLTAASVIILAGGKSSRMGQPKALLPFDNEPIITHLVRATELLHGYCRRRRSRLHCCRSP